MNRLINYALATTGVLAAFSFGMPTAANADSYCMRTTTLNPVYVNPGVNQYSYVKTTTTTTSPAPAAQIVTIEKPVVVEKTIRTYDKQIINHRTIACAPRTHKTCKVVHKTCAHRVYRSCPSKVSMIRERTVVVQKPVIVEKKVFINRPVTRVVERPVVIEKRVVVDRPCALQRDVVIQRSVVIERRNPMIIEERRHYYDSHHLLKVKTPLAGVSIF